MKVALYIEDGMMQLALSPQNEWEKNVLRNITEHAKNVTIHRAEFYRTGGGYQVYDSSSTDSVMLRIEDRPSDVKQPG